MNPFTLTPIKLTDAFMSWQKIYPKPYDKMDIDPYTRVRVILMNGTEFEASTFSHQFQRHESNNDLRRELALLRRQEQQQQKRLSCLKPLNETVLEHTIGYEQLAVDLTAALAQRVTCPHVKSSLDFALLEDFDHLYRYADLLEMEHGIYAEKLVGSYTEIMPGRPTISEHRNPYDALCAPGKADAALFDKMAVQIITAAEQQTMNFYMNVCGLYTSDLGRRLYQEIGQIEEQHVTQYASLMDPNTTWLENLVMHQYVEAYLYYSCMLDETDENVKKVWEEFFQMEVAHLHKAAELLKRFENKEWQQVIPEGEFPAPIKFQSNIAYVRDVMKMAHFTAEKEVFKPVDMLPKNYEFFQFQQAVNSDINTVPSHQVIDLYIQQNGTDYRAETAPNPIPALQNRRMDNVSLGRVPQ
ncbi:MAG: hypothetical protein GX096_13205 [Clostridiales bacterium]|nr:hypothetical protein [Clostridiales bacterium]